MCNVDKWSLWRSHGRAFYVFLLSSWETSFADRHNSVCPCPELCMHKPAVHQKPHGHEYCSAVPKLMNWAQRQDILNWAHCLLKISTWPPAGTMCRQSIAFSFKRSRSYTLSYLPSSWRLGMEEVPCWRKEMKWRCHLPAKQGWEGNSMDCGQLERN